jgi:hypothetical protein
MATNATQSAPPRQSATGAAPATTTPAALALTKSKVFAVVTGKCPESSGECEFKISTSKIRWLNTHGPTDVFYSLKNVPFTMSEPCAIFKGLEREGQENSYCYVAKPNRRFRGEDQSVAVGEEWVFLVFLSSNLEIFNWRFERADAVDNFVPENYKTRFKKLLWQSQR